MKTKGYILVGGMLIHALLFAQKGTVKFSVNKYPFIHNDRNEIVNDKTLAPLFEKLYALKTGNSQRINILQIGDSHIQADFLSAQVRTNFHNDFGNAGRGLIVPLKVARTNEPFNYKTTSNITWESKRCVFVNNPLPIGVGGVTIKTNNDSAQLYVRTADYPPRGYGFNKVTLFYEKDSAAFDFKMTDTSGNMIAMLKNDQPAPCPNITTVLLTGNTNDFILKAEKNNTYQNNATIFGLSLENDSIGVLYHSVGVNGAECFQYAAAKYFAEQTQVLNPDLIIISLGTNEAQRRPFDKVAVTSQVDSLVCLLQLHNPNVPILFTTPPDSYRSKKYYNIAVSQMHEVIVKYARENNLAVWDLFSIAGGYKSAAYWRKYGLLRSDGVHFNRKGYEFQGNLLYEALIKDYNKYVSARP